MDAMAARSHSQDHSTSHSSHGVNQLWQMPLLVLSLALFMYAAWLLWDPKPGPTVDERLAIARTYLDSERPQATVTLLNSLSQLEQLTPQQQGKLHLLYAESMELYAQQHPQVALTVQPRIVDQTRQAMAYGSQPVAKDFKRLAKAYENLNKPDEALTYYRRAQAMDPDKSLAMQKKIITLMLDRADLQSADRELAEYLRDQRLQTSEKSWALQQRAKVLCDQSRFGEARGLLDQALSLADDDVQRGEVNFYLGYASFKLGENDDADRFLRVARQQMQCTHPLDADASFYLGRVAQIKQDPETSISFYQHLLVDHPDSKLVPLAKLGRGICRTMSKQDDAALEDLTALGRQLDDHPKWEPHRAEIVAGVRQAATMMSNRGNLQGALELASTEQSLAPELPPEFFGRLASIYERRADQVEQAKVVPGSADAIKIAQQASELRVHAADGYVAYAQKVASRDDKAHADSLWHGIDLYDRAGNTTATIRALELYIADRPEDSQTPAAQLRLGRAYQSLGQFDKAISAFQNNQIRYPKSLATAQSLVPLAQSYLARGPEYAGRAEATFKSVIDNNPLLDPTSDEFKMALFGLGDLCYRNARYEEAIAKFEEFAKRYPNEERTGQMLFLMGDSYRKSAQLLTGKLAVADASDAPTPDPVEVEKARRERLQKSKALYDRLVDMYRDNAPSSNLEQLYFKLSHFYRADCLYDLGEYADAIKLYDVAAFRYQDDPSALAAYVQIVNSYCRLGKTAEAKAANERAKWLLRRIPPESFSNGSFAMPKEYWEQWLKWSNESRMW